MRIRCVSGTELTGTHDGLAFGVVSWAGVAARTSSEDGGLASFESGCGHVEDKLEARCSRNNDCHSVRIPLVDRSKG
jgi:hypothetical protein